MCVSIVFSNMSRHVSEECVLGQTRFFWPSCRLSTPSPKGYCPKPIHHHHRPRQLPAPPSAWENHTGMSLRDTAAQINKPSPLQVCAGEDNGGKCVYMHASAFVCVFLLATTKCVYVFVSICVFEPFLISEQWVHTVRGGNQYQLSSSRKRVKRSIPPQHDNSSRQAWLILMSVWSSTEISRTWNAKKKSELSSF